MRVAVVHDHPWDGSLNAAALRELTRTLAEAGHEADVINPRGDGFNPVMSSEELRLYPSGRFIDPLVGEYQARLGAAEHLFLLFPVWWDTAPALLKGFFDKVFLPGWAFAEADFSPLLGRVRGATVATTMGAPVADTVSVRQAVCDGLLRKCGVAEVAWLNILDVGNSSLEAREAWLESIRARARGLGPGRV